MAKEVTISWETAEYLAVFLGQNVWGNRIRRRKAINDLANAMGKEPLTNSLECFDDTKR